MASTRRYFFQASLYSVASKHRCASSSKSAVSDCSSHGLASCGDASRLQPKTPRNFTFASVNVSPLTTENWSRSQLGTPFTATAARGRRFLPSQQASCFETSKEPGHAEQQPEGPPEHPEHPFTATRGQSPNRICAHLGFIPALQNPRQPEFVDRDERQKKQAERHDGTDSRVREVEPYFHPDHTSNDGQDRSELEPAECVPLVVVVCRGLDGAQAIDNAGDPTRGTEHVTTQDDGDFCEWAGALRARDANRCC